MEVRFYVGTNINFIELLLICQFSTFFYLQNLFRFIENKIMISNPIVEDEQSAYKLSSYCKKYKI